MEAEHKTSVVPMQGCDVCSLWPSKAMIQRSACAMWSTREWLIYQLQAALLTDATDCNLAEFEGHSHRVLSGLHCLVCS